MPSRCLPCDRHGPRVALVARSMACLACAFCCGTAAAHKPSDSYLTLRPDDHRISVRWDIALRDLDNELGLDTNDDGALTWGEIRSRERDIDALVLAQLTVTSDRIKCTVEKRADAGGAGGTAEANLAEKPAAPSFGGGVLHQLDRHSDGTYAVLSFVLSCPSAVGDVEVDYRLFSSADPTHRGIVSVLWPSLPGAVAATAVLGPDNPHRRFTPFAPSRWETLREFVIEGIWHIWLGFDHILFLLSLLLPAVLAGRSRRGMPEYPHATTLRSAALDVLKIVTAFTVSHSITLTLAVLDLVSLPARLVESGIAFTVILASVNNLLPVVRDRRWIAAFVFGLIHGFGFAAALKDLGLSPQSLALSLFGFNLGVEIGQLAIVAFFLPLAFLIRNTPFYRVAVFRVGSAVVALIALFWFVERAFDVDLSRLRI